MSQTLTRRLLTEWETCKYLGVSRSFLAKSRMNGTLPNQTAGPPFVRLGRKAIRYAVEDLDNWIAENRHPITRAVNPTR